MQIVDAVFFELRSFLGHGPTRWITIEWVCLVDRLCRVMDRVQYFAPDKLKFKAYINPNHHPRHTSPHFHFFFLLIIFPHTTPLFASGFFAVQVAHASLEMRISIASSIHTGFQSLNLMCMCSLSLSFFFRSIVRSYIASILSWFGVFFLEYVFYS